MDQREELRHAVEEACRFYGAADPEAIAERVAAAWEKRSLAGESAEMAEPDTPEPPRWLSAEAAYGWGAGWEAGFAARASQPSAGEVDG